MRQYICAAAIAATLPFAASADAGVIDFTDLLEGKEGQTLEIDGVSVGIVSEPHGVVIDPQGGAGAQGGGEDNEIGSADFWEITFSVPVFVEKMQITRLRTAGTPDDIIDEGIKVVSDNGEYTFTSVDAEKGTLLDRPDLGGVVKVNSTGGPGGTGTFTFIGDELFGGPVTSIRLTGDPIDVFPLTGSGFLFNRLNFTPVPAPGAAALFGLGGLALARRRR